MKKTLFILITLLPFLTIGQNWAPVGATWYYGFSVWTNAGYYKIENVGDTTILTNQVHAFQCNKLQKTHYNKNLVTQTIDTVVIGTEYTYSDNDKVYIYKHHQFYTLYDFSAQIGDTWIVPEISRYDGCDSIGTIRVDSIGTMTINTENLRYICVSLLDTMQKWGWKAKIVEKVGPIKSYSSYPYAYLFPQKFDYCGMILDEYIEGGNFRCYSDNSSFSYSPELAPACDFITSVNTLDEISAKITIFPNPSNGSFKVYFDNLSIKDVIISDLIGKTIQQYHSIKQSNVEINNLSTGTYIITLIDNDNNVINKKIISCP